MKIIRSGRGNLLARKLRDRYVIKIRSGCVIAGRAITQLVFIIKNLGRYCQRQIMGKNKETLDGNRPFNKYSVKLERAAG